MADQLYGYKSIYGAAAASSKVGLGLSLGLGSGPGPGLGVAAPTSSRYNRLGSPEASYLSPSSSSLYLPKSIKKKNDPFSYSTSDIGAYSWDNASEYDPMASGIKRSSHALYHPSMYGAQNTTVQSEAWYTTDSLSKRTRVESASNLPIYPQRPGEKDCAHYMLTRTCKFGNSCKFDHPIWVPEGGIPDWKEVPLLATTESFPERLGEPDCPYFLKTQRCKFGLRCKFNHPKNCTTLSAPENYASATLPERPSEPPCAFYMKNGICKFGATCKFHHPHDINPLETDQDNGDGKQNDSLEKSEGTIGDVKLVKPFSSFSFSPALLHNSKGLPIRPGEVDCPFYVKTGSCKYGATCRYNHPGRNIDPPATAMGALLANTAGNADISVAPIASIYETIKPSFSPVMFGVSHGTYPQRPGQAECDYYMKTGACKFGERCKFHHPVDRLAQTSLTNQSQQSVKLTLAGLPRREGTIFCPYYLKTGTCKFGATCKFDHPPPGEVMTMAASQGASVTAEAEAKE